DSRIDSTPCAMPNCAVRRTHRFGRKLRDSDREAIPGPITMYSIYVEHLNRYVNCLKVDRMAHGGADRPSPIPNLMDVVLMGFRSDRAMMVRGFEEVDGARYYQGWHIGLTP